MITALKQLEAYLGCAIHVGTFEEDSAEAKAEFALAAMELVDKLHALQEAESAKKNLLAHVMALRRIQEAAEGSQTPSEG